MSKEFILTNALSKCDDFINEKTDIEQLCEDVSIHSPKNCEILFTPKFHCELAGEGIEYAWGMMKRIYRNAPMETKRLTKGFQLLVQQCARSVSLNSARLFSKKARRYMVVYHHQRLELKDVGERVSKWSHEKTEKI